MNRRLVKSFSKFDKSISKEPEILSGFLGIPLSGSKIVEVPGRNSYVYVRLRNNQNELIQAFNNKVAVSYNLPVLLRRDGNKYVVLGVDTKRYENNWENFAPYLPRHGNSHSLDFENGGGGDVVWVQSRQIMPMLTSPSGSVGGPNVIISPYTLLDAANNWRYIGNTGTVDLTQYNPTGTSAIIILVSIDTTTGNPFLTVNSGTYFPNSLTGTSQIIPYIPTPPDLTRYIPDSAIRLITGTKILSWDNIYDVRQFFRTLPTGSASGGGGSGTFIINNYGVGLVGWDEGIFQGTGTILNVRGQNAVLTVSGTVIDVFITGSSSAGGIPSGTIQIYNTGSFVGSADQLDFQYPLAAGFTGTRAYPYFQGTLLAWEDVSAQITGSNTHFVITGTIALMTDRLFYNGLRQQRLVHYAVDSDGHGFSTFFTGTFGDVLIMEYGNLGVQAGGLSDLPIYSSGTLIGNAKSLNFVEGVYPQMTGTRVDIVGIANRFVANTGSVTPAEAYARWDASRKLLVVHDTRREKPVTPIGWQPFVFPLGFFPGTINSLSLPTNGGTVIFAMPVYAPMLLDSASIVGTDTSGTHTWGWDLYADYLDVGNLSERVAQSNGNGIFTGTSAIERQLAALGSPVILPPGLYWLAIQNRHASNILKIQTHSNLSNYTYGRTKTTNNPNSSSIDLSTGWSIYQAIGEMKLNGRVFGENTPF